MQKTRIIKVIKAYANTNAGTKLYVSSVAQNADLDRSGYEALTWVEIGFISSIGDRGTKTNLLTYNTFDTTVVQKAKGLRDAGSPDIEVARSATDAGQIILNNAAALNNSHAFKELRLDGSTAANGTVFYNRGLITTGMRKGGGIEDFDVRVYTLAFLQEEIEVAASGTGTAPYITSINTITGTATVGQVLTATTGTWAGDATITYTYQWWANNVAIAGATSGTYTLLAAQSGKRITCRVTATNGAGTASSTSAPTTAVS